MRGGGSISGISEIVSEFNSSIVGVGVAISSIEPKKKKIDNYTSIIQLGDIDFENKKIETLPTFDII